MDNPQNTFIEILASEEKHYAEVLSKIDALVKDKVVREERIANIKKLIASYTDTGEEIMTQARISFSPVLRLRTHSAANAIRKLIDRQTDEYTVQSIQALCENEYPGIKFSRNGFHVIVNGLAEEGKVKIIERGAGNNPSRYRNIRQTSILDGLPKTDNLTKEG